MQETSQYEINLISGKIKNAIDLAKPFYECRRQASELQKELKVDQSNHERAKTNLAAAKEMVFLAEQSVTQVRANCLIDSITALSNCFTATPECTGGMRIGHCTAGNDKPCDESSQSIHGWVQSVSQLAIHVNFILSQLLTLPACKIDCASPSWSTRWPSYTQANSNHSSRATSKSRGELFPFHADDSVFYFFSQPASVHFHSLISLWVLWVRVELLL